MCLYVDHRTTEIKLKNRSPRIFYKVFLKKIDYLETPYQKHIIKGPGIITIPEPLNRLDMDGAVMVSRGALHARTTPDATQPDEFYARFFKLGETVTIPIHIKYDDILVYGLQNSVAITAYEIKEETWNGTFI